MGTPFLTILEPTRLDGYNPKLPHNKQPAHIPQAYIDAMSVREAVFVKEHGSLQEHEHDADDARSCHLVMYASVQETVVPKKCDPVTGLLIQKPCSKTKTVPIGTLRIVPFPHPPHPPMEGRYVGGVLQYDNNDKTGDGSLSKAAKRKQSSESPDGTLDGTAKNMPRRHPSFSLAEHRRLSDPLPFGADRQTEYHDGKESYIKIGRLSVLPEYRDFNIAAQLWQAAQDWLRTHADCFNPNVAVLGMRILRVEDAVDIPAWNGLVCVHAHVDDTEGYERWGFKVDKGMGKWYEDGHPHVGMFRRIEIIPMKRWS